MLFCDHLTYTLSCLLQQTKFNCSSCRKFTLSASPFTWSKSLYSASEWKTAHGLPEKSVPVFTFVWMEKFKEVCYSWGLDFPANDNHSFCPLMEISAVYINYNVLEQETQKHKNKKMFNSTSHAHSLLLPVLWNQKIAKIEPDWRHETGKKYLKQQHCS